MAPLSLPRSLLLRRTTLPTLPLLATQLLSRQFHRLTTQQHSFSSSLSHTNAQSQQLSQLFQSLQHTQPRSLATHSASASSHDTSDHGSHHDHHHHEPDYSYDHSFKAHEPTDMWQKYGGTILGSIMWFWLVKMWIENWDVMFGLRHPFHHRGEHEEEEHDTTTGKPDADKAGH